MKHIAITGGIGAGKSFICNILKQRGISIYDCDSEAKRLMKESDTIRQRMKSLIGENAYTEDTPNKAVIAEFLLQSEDNKQAINSIVHPIVMEDFQQSGKQWMECAILYEAHLEQYVDTVIAVTAPKEVRIERIMRRDNISREKAEQWLNAQYPQEEIERRADFVIINDNTLDINKQIEEIWQRLF